MPGICGLITKRSREWAERELALMLAAMSHEEFYQSGTLIDEGIGLYLGWVVKDRSFSQGMPLHNENGDVALVFSGEEFPEPGTKGNLKRQGHGVEDRESSYLVHLYEQDPAFPACLNGRFHGVVADRARRTAVLFNDRYGMERVYFHETSTAFYFAAEAKAVLKACPALCSYDQQALGEFIACGCTLENRTLYRGLHILPPGSAWSFCRGETQERGQYFEPRQWEEQSPLEPESFYEEVKDVFTRNLPRYFGGTERIGMSLTAGLDTRMIMAWQSCPPGSLSCYSFAGMFRECHDVSLARKVARTCQQAHEVIEIGQVFLSRFAHYAERAVYVTDGCSDVSQAPEVYANERAREIAPVRMTGNYGGEVLRGVRLFKVTAPLPGLFDSSVLAATDRATQTCAGLAQTHPLSYFLFRQAPWHHYPRLALEQSQVSLRSPFLDNDLVRTLFRAPVVNGLGLATCLRLIGDGRTVLGRIRTDMGLMGTGGWMPGAMRQRLSMFSHKAEYAYDYGMPQWLARIDHLLSPFRPERLFLGRHKFYHFRVWYRGVLAKYIQEILLDPRSLARPYLRRTQVEAVVRDHIKGVRNYTSSIHKLLTLELTHRLFLDGR